jgi:lipopolysaccharide/colanic/teichoic acid biosynthesis glycosyltransferase
MNFYRKYGKRLFDVLLSLCFLFCFLWVYLLIVLIYLFTINLPVFYTSLRIGKNGKTFRMIKFRTLHPDEQLPLHQRTFWLGKWLRKTNLDELPQVWHVLRGEMSWVGPRPLPSSYETMLTDYQKVRYSVLPGITGLAQVNGKNSLPWEKKFEYDLQYVNDLSLLNDVIILFRTLVIILSFKEDVSLDEKPLLQNKQNC